MICKIFLQEVCKLELKQPTINDQFPRLVMKKLLYENYVQKQHTKLCSFKAYTDEETTRNKKIE